MILGSKGEVQGRWFTFAGSKARLCANYPSTELWERHMKEMGDLNPGTASPLEPAKRDIVAIYRVHRETLVPCLTGIEFEGFEGAAASGPEGWDSDNWADKIINSGPLQYVITDFAGWLFRDSAAFCDDGPGEAA